MIILIIGSQILCNIFNYRKKELYPESYRMYLHSSLHPCMDAWSMEKMLYLCVFLSNSINKEFPRKSKDFIHSKLLSISESFLVKHAC